MPRKPAPVQERILKKVFAKELRADGHKRRLARDNTKIKNIVQDVVQGIFSKIFKK
jgi:hypothetical protein